MLRFTSREIRELLKAWLLLSLAFAILFANPLENGFGFVILVLLGISLVTAGLGFLVHELAHKYVAERYGCNTEFRADNGMIAFALAMSFFGFIFAAPGAVFISGSINRKQNGRISLAGPASNIALALLFLALLPLSGIFFYGFQINAWIALFNMIPFGNFDGRKIWLWDRKVYIASVIIALALTMLGFFL